MVKIQRRPRCVITGAWAEGVVLVRKLMVGVGVIAAASLLAACSSSSSSSATDSSGTAAGSAASSTVTVTVISQDTGPDFSSPDVPPVATATVAQINSSGGLAGHQIHLVVCNDNQDPTTGGNCARAAVADHSVAVVEGISEEGGTIDPILQAAGIPLILSPVVPADYSDPDAFLKDGGTITLWGAQGELLAKNGCRKIGILYDNSNASGETGPAIVKAGVEASGIASVVATEGVPEESPDLQPLVTTLEQAGADCIASTLTPDQQVDAIRAIHQSAKPNIRFGAIGPSLPNALASQLGQAANGALITTVMYLQSDPRAAAFNSLVTANKIPNVTGFGENAYEGLEILKAGAQDIHGSLTAASVLHALDTASSLTVPTAPHALDFTDPTHVTGFTREMNLYAVGYEWNGTNYVSLPASEGIVNTAAAFDRYTASSS
jgi:ABC-type branched-subunit amino acid transport system substrate-binding protein